MPELTNEQKQVIDSRDQSLLVSAAAGSGKTEVLVRRIMEKAMDPEDPVDLDRLLVVTFTNAAASSLREKIRKRLEDEAQGNDPGRAKIARRQLMMLSGDHIETIDRFCREIVMDHADALEIDPAFRIADEGELKLLQSEVVSQVIEESFQDPDTGYRDRFLEFARLYASGKTDQGLEDLILGFYDFSMSHEFPRMWRHGCADLYRGSADNTEWSRDLGESIRLCLEEIHESLMEGLRICSAPDGPYHYSNAMADHEALLQSLMQCTAMSEYGRLLKDYPWPKPGIKKRGKNAVLVDAAMEAQVKEIRNLAKKELDKLAESFFFAPEDQMEKMRLSTACYMDTLVSLTDRFEDRFAKEKEARRIADFPDVAHWALKVLICVGEDGMPILDERGGYIRTELAEEYKEYFREIYIDEYQDSNRVQEILLQSIARPQGRFMVGDMKQSIYRFRMADTGIFAEKADSYSTAEDAPERRIDLHRNFRSRACVLDLVNLVFRRIMRREIGGVEYDQDQELRPGYVFPPIDSIMIDTKRNNSTDIEITEPDSAQNDSTKIDQRESESLVDPDDMLPEIILAERGDVPNASKQAEAEAAVVAQRIQDMIGRQEIYDKEAGSYRPAEYRDITILLRTASVWAETFSKVLDEYGIPNRPNASTGYFDAVEVRTVLAYLNVLDNPRQDIPLAASLRSMIGGLSDRELALIRAEMGKGALYDGILAYLEKGKDADIRQKLEHFLENTRKLRALVKDTPIHILLWKIFDETGYEDKISATNGGRQKKANLALLVDMAMAYEETSYRGLFHFVRYIEKLRKAQRDVGQAAGGGGQENLVRIMTMHKSKGLEFPVVFVCGLNKGFNLQDASGSLVLHEHLGAGLDFRDARLRGKMTNRIRSAIARRIRTDSIGEELRILYVAMTRAEQKLILTGCVDKRLEVMEKAKIRAGSGDGKLTGRAIEGASSMLDWILMAISGKGDGGDLSERFIFRSGAEVMAGGARQSREEERLLSDLLTPDPEEVTAPALHERLEHMLSTSYLWSEGRDHMPGKLSVSQIKHGAYVSEMRRILIEEEGTLVVMNGPGEPFDGSVEEDGLIRILPDETAAEVEVPVPEFLKEDQAKKSPSVTDVGSAYHTVLAGLDYTSLPLRSPASVVGAGLDVACNYAKDRTLEYVRSQLETMIKCDKIHEEEVSRMDPGRIAAFLSSGLAERMGEAAKVKMLWREQPFVISRSAGLLNPEWSMDEKILIQGIIDAFFIEENQIVLIDYKSDRAKPGDEESLVRRYRVQFELYADALEKLLQMKVKEAWLYSLSLQKEIPVKLA